MWKWQILTSVFAFMVLWYPRTALEPPGSFLWIIAHGVFSAQKKQEVSGEMLDKEENEGWVFMAGVGLEGVLRFPWIFLLFR